MKKKHLKYLALGLMGLIVIAIAFTAFAGATANPKAAATFGGASMMVGIAGVLTAERNTPSRMGNRVTMGVATGVTIFAGALVMRSATGYATPGDEALNCVGVGRANESVVNTGADGAKTIDVDTNIYRFKNSAAADAITIAERGLDCYIVDDDTVAKTDGNGTRSLAGRIFDVDDSGVWVEFSKVPRTALVTEAELTAYNADGRHAKRVARFTFDPSGVAGQRTIAKHGLGVFLPDNAIGVRFFYEGLTTLTSATDAATVAFGLDTDDEDCFLAAVAISAGGNHLDAGYHDGIQDGAAANFAAKTTAQREICATVAVEALTAGKIVGFVEYVVTA